MGKGASRLDHGVKHHTYGGEAAVTFWSGRYSAMILPAIGGNLVAFEEADRQLTFLHTPSEEDMDAFRKAPHVYGWPVLFPPNRMEDGTFTWNGRSYQFPVNEAETHNHIHGFLRGVPWGVVAAGSSTEEAFVEVAVHVDAGHPVYVYFPHDFTVSIRYTLSQQGLRQDVRVTNHGPERMPLMLGFHTTLQVPFDAASRPEDYTFAATVEERWEMSERMLPTGRHLELTDEEIAMRGAGVFPFYGFMDNLYSAGARDGRNAAVLTDHRRGIRLVYEVDRAYGFWMICNVHGKQGAFFAEPQTCLVNAPNAVAKLGLSEEAAGLIAVDPDGTWSATSRLYVEEV